MFCCMEMTFKNRTLVPQVSFCCTMARVIEKIDQFDPSNFYTLQIGIPFDEY